MQRHEHSSGFCVSGGNISIVVGGDCALLAGTCDPLTCFPADRTLQVRRCAYDQLPYMCCFRLCMLGVWMPFKL